MARDTSPPAFPRPASVDPTNGTLPDGDEVIGDQQGMTLRDYFAAHILQGMLAGGSVPMPFQEGWEGGQRRAVHIAWTLAGDMLAEREKT